jgi:hypothetical protein
MISLVSRPECFDYLAKIHLWVKAEDEDGVYCYVGLRFEGPVGNVHLRVKRWSRGVLRSMQSDWPEVLEICRRNGAKHLVAANEDYEDKRWPKLIQKFGFPKPQVISTSVMEL